MHLGQHSGDGVADVADPIRGAGVCHGERDRDREVERGEWIEMGQYRGERGRMLKRPRKEDVETERSREMGECPGLGKLTGGTRAYFVERDR